jgi:TPP-dependent pyruvate/acetoin dehydrogenase alpha subunit
VQTSSEIHRIAQGFGMPTYTVDGTWFEPMYQMLPPVIEMIRQGGGPALVDRCRVLVHATVRFHRDQNNAEIRMLHQSLGTSPGGLQP